MKQSATRIRVKYTGKVIECHHAADTVEKVIKKLIDEFGAAQVIRADRSSNSPYSQRLVTTSRADFEPRRYSSHGNVYISRDWNSYDKKRILEDIARNLGVSMTIKVIPK